MVNHPHRNKRKIAAQKAIQTSGTQQKSSSKSPFVADAQHDHDYSGLLAGVQTSFHTAVSDCDNVLFTTDATGLWEKYLSLLAPSDPKLRQVHNCHCCRRFIETYGGLVTINPHGATRPVMWSLENVPNFYAAAFLTLWKDVKGARVTGIFKTTANIWGSTKTGEWSHMLVMPPVGLIHCNRALTPRQAMAAASENVETVRRAIVYYSPAVLDEALRLFENGVLDRSEKFVGPVKWLRELHDWPKGRHNQDLRQNILWRAVALAPEGYCHIKSSVIGAMLDDIVMRVPFDDIVRKHGARTRSDVYQRPQELPNEGNVKAAEALFEKLGLAPALKRRFATLEDLQLDWISADATVDLERPRAGIFGSVPVRPGRSLPPTKNIEMPPVVMTWDKFSRTVLPNAMRIDAMIRPVDGFFALTAAEDPAAPPLLKWDDYLARNTVGWYTYVSPTPASLWGLKEAGWTRVNAITPTPNLWGARPSPQHCVGVFLVLDGAVDTKNNALALFAEHLRSEVYPARATIEQFSMRGKLSGADKATACGLMIRGGASGSRSERVLRAYDGKTWTSYLIDRWD